jgi:hypothetical protein
MSQEKPNRRRFKTGRDVEEYRNMPGDTGAAMRLAYGHDDYEFHDILMDEIKTQDAKRPGAFKWKYRGG